MGIGFQNAGFIGLGSQDFVAQPYIAKVDFFVGSINLCASDPEDTNNYSYSLIDFEHQRQAGLSHTFKITLHDKYWINIEKILYEGGTNVTFQKYYTSAESPGIRLCQSPMYGGVITRWTPTLQQTGTLLTIEGVGFLGANRTEKIIAWSGPKISTSTPISPDFYVSNPDQDTPQTLSGDLTIAQVVKLICDGTMDPGGGKEFGKPWDLDIVPTKKVSQINSLQSTDALNKMYTQGTMGDWEFLQFLATHAVAENDEGGPFMVWETESSEGPVAGPVKKTVHFRPVKNGDQFKPVRRYTYNYGMADQEVISFSPSVQIDYLRTNPGTSVVSMVSDAASKVFEWVRSSQDHRPEDSQETGKYVVIKPKFQDTFAAAPRFLANSFQSIDAALNMTSSLWWMYYLHGMTAKLVIQGYGSQTNIGPAKTIDPFDVIEIYVLTSPDIMNQAAGEGRDLHPSSGQYLIKIVTDYINGGSWTTAVDLMRQGQLMPSGLIQNNQFAISSLGGLTRTSPMDTRGGDVPASAGEGPPASEAAARAKQKSPVCGSYAGGNTKFGANRATEKDPDRVHEGIDIGTAPGTPITLQEPVKITFAGEQSGYGNVVYAEGTQTGNQYRFAHLSEMPGKGVTIPAGSTIGLTGGTKGAPGAGNSEGPHLHLEVLQDGKPVDPLTVFETPQPCSH